MSRNVREPNHKHPRGAELGLRRKRRAIARMLEQSRMHVSARTWRNTLSVVKLLG